MSVNQHNAPRGAKPYLFVTVDEKAYSLPLSSVAEVSRTTHGAGEMPSSIVLRGREMRLLNLSDVLGSQQAVRRIARLRLGSDEEIAIAVPVVVGTRWRLENTLHPVDSVNLASYETYAQKALGLLRLVGAEHPGEDKSAPAADSSAQESK